MIINGEENITADEKIHESGLTNKGGGNILKKD